MNKENLIEKIEAITEELTEVYNKYVELTIKFETYKIANIDYTIRDSIEKQLGKLMQSDNSFKELHLEVEKLRRTRDLKKIQLDAYKTILNKLD